MTTRTHACGRPDDECICITEQELADASPNVQRIVRNAITLMNAQARQAQVPVANCDSQEYEDADEYEEADIESLIDDLRSVYPSPATEDVNLNMVPLVGEDANLDMIPPTINYVEESGKDREE